MSMDLIWDNMEEVWIIITRRFFTYFNIWRFINNENFIVEATDYHLVQVKHIFQLIQMLTWEQSSIWQVKQIYGEIQRLLWIWLELLQEQMAVLIMVQQILVQILGLLNGSVNLFICDYLFWGIKKKDGKKLFTLFFLGISWGWGPCVIRQYRAQHLKDNIREIYENWRKTGLTLILLVFTFNNLVLAP